MMTYGVTQIAQLFPSLKRIKDKSLREKVAAVWSEAITTGCGGKGWTFDELRAVKFTLLAGDIVTLEPGLYVNGIGGIRIEHNYLITSTGMERLSNHTIALR